MHDSLQQRLENEKIEKLKMFKIMLERIMLFLRLNKQDIQLIHKDKLVSVEKNISKFLSSNLALSKTSSSPQQGQLHQSSMQLQQPQSLAGQTNPPMQPIQGSLEAMQQSYLTNLQHYSLSGVSTISNSQLHMINVVKPGSRWDLGQGNSLKSPQQVATGSLQQNPVNSLQHDNISSFSTQGGMNPVQANLEFLQQNSNALPHLLPTQHEQQMLQNQQLTLLCNQLLMQQQLFQTPLDSSVQTGNSNGADWQEEVYQKHPQHEKIEKLEIFKMTLECIVLFLRINKREIQLSHKEKLFSLEKYITFFLSGKSPHSPTTSPLHRQLP
ncbi:hypothetical protein KY284_019545 [Solanum tuberosum]|nr:hypothetical protein KY284_019545 [Solanum tuberosum]